MRFARIFVALLVFCGAIYAEDEFRKRGESNAKSTTKPKTTQDSAYQKRSDSPKNATKQKIKKDEAQKNDSPKNAPKNTGDSRQDSRQDSKDLKTDSQTQKTTNQTPKKPQSTQNKSAEIKKLTTKKKPLGYRNVTIQNIKKQQKVGIDFFVGLQFGIDIASMQDIQQIDRDTHTRKSTTASGSFGLKGGIISEDEWVGGRFYAELSYLKIPKFDMLNVGVDLDLLIKYYETPSYKIGGFIGAGGGMNSAFIADKSLDNAGTKSLISVGWVNVGLVRFVYFHSTGIHGAELNAKIVYVTPTIYSLKDKNTGITTAYKASSSTIMLSYTYQF